jgi:hypothetical protein
MADIFGYNRSGNAFAQIVSSEFATVSIGGSGGGNLLQSFQASYQQDLRPFFAIGDPNLYWVSGFPQGQVDFERAVASAGFFAGLKGQCGIINNITVNASGGQRCATGGGGGTVAFGGAIVQSVRIRMAAGQTEVIEGATIRVSQLQA